MKSSGTESSSTYFQEIDDVEEKLIEEYENKDGESEPTRNSHFAKHGATQNSTPKFIFFDFECTQARQKFRIRV